MTYRYPAACGGCSSFLVCLASFAFADVVVDEDFEGGVLPTGWQIWEFGNTGAIAWEICEVGDYTYMPDPAHSGTHYAWHDDGSDTCPASDSWLITDTYDLSTYSTVTVDFWRYGKYDSYYDYTAFYYSTVTDPGQGDFTELIELGPNNFDEWWEFAVDVSAECASQSYVTFAWVYAGTWAHAEAIDDFLLEGFSVALERDTWGAIKSTF